MGTAWRRRAAEAEEAAERLKDPEAGKSTRLSRLDPSAAGHSRKMGRIDKSGKLSVAGARRVSNADGLQDEEDGAGVSHDEMLVRIGDGVATHHSSNRGSRGNSSREVAGGHSHCSAGGGKSGTASKRTVSGMDEVDAESMLANEPPSRQTTGQQHLVRQVRVMNDDI